MNRGARDKKSRAWAGILAVSLFGTLALQFRAQSLTGTVVRTLAITTSGQAVTANQTQNGVYREGIYREIDDLHTGDRWLLMRDGNNPAGPGRMVLVSKTVSGSGQPSGQPSGPGGSLETKPSMAVIHRGDSLIVIEETAVLSEQLEAVALESAAQGSIFQVRLKLGGLTYRAVATGPGRARFSEGQGGQ